MSRKYPDDFNTPTFPAGPHIAVSRAMSIAIMVVFVLIMCVGGMIYWMSRVQQVHPFLVAIDDVTGIWRVVGHDHGMRTTSTNLSMQESVIADFTKNWFTISAIPAENDALWMGLSKKEECNAYNREPGANIYCTAADSVYNKFTGNIVPDYQLRIADGETWSVDVDNIYLNQTSSVGDNGGTWRALAQIDSNLYGGIQVMAYITLGRDMNKYPKTLGFYVTDFNAYRMDTE